MIISVYHHNLNLCLFYYILGTSQIELPKSVDLKTLLSDTTSDILDNDLAKPQTSS